MPQFLHKDTIQLKEVDSEWTAWRETVLVACDEEEPQNNGTPQVVEKTITGSGTTYIMTAVVTVRLTRLYIAEVQQPMDLRRFPFDCQTMNVLSTVFFTCFPLLYRTCRVLWKECVGSTPNSPFSNTVY